MSCPMCRGPLSSGLTGAYKNSITVRGDFKICHDCGNRLIWIYDHAISLVVAAMALSAVMWTVLWAAFKS